ncbi:hypothetical protein AB6D11_01045 [Vibrio splendidus]
MKSYSFTDLIYNFIGIISASYILSLLTFTVLLGNIVYALIYIIKKYCARHCSTRKTKAEGPKAPNLNQDDSSGD